MVFILEILDRMILNSGLFNKLNDSGTVLFFRNLFHRWCAWGGVYLINGICDNFRGLNRGAKLVMSRHIKSGVK